MEHNAAALYERMRIAALGSQIAMALDRRDTALLRSCFTEDATLVVDGVGAFEGIDAITASLAVLTRLDATQHVIANQMIELMDDRAKMDSYFIATHIKHDHPGGSIFTVGGSYSDEVRQVAGEWRILRRAAKLLWSTGNAAMLFGEH